MVVGELIRKEFTAMAIDKINDVLRQCGEIDQIGVICSDLEKTKDAMKNIFGLETPEVDYQKDYELIYRGSTEFATAKVCAYRYFNVELEFIQPVGEGKTAWHDYLKMGQYGLHHIRFNVSNYQEAYLALKEKGLEVWIEGEGTGSPGLKYAYFDGLETLGFVIEIINWKEITD